MPEGEGPRFDWADAIELLEFLENTRLESAPIEDTGG